MVAAISVILARIESAPNYNTVMHALTMVQSGVNTAAETVQTIATKAQWTAEVSQRAILNSQETEASIQNVVGAENACCGICLVRVRDDVHDIVAKVSEVI